jgi:hypothetical protein
LVQNPDLKPLDLDNTQDMVETLKSHVISYSKCNGCRMSKLRKVQAAKNKLRPLPVVFEGLEFAYERYTPRSETRVDGKNQRLKAFSEKFATFLMALNHFKGNNGTKKQMQVGV